jgi:flavorubredoxin
MHMTGEIRNIGVDDRQIDLFEGQYAVPGGMTYNSYLIPDERTAVMDTVDGRFVREWLDRLDNTLAGRKPAYLIVQHMEPDHSSGIRAFLERYPDAVTVASAKAFEMMRAFFGVDPAERRLVVGEGDTLSLGRHTLRFLTAPMVHWPEVVMTYDETEKTFFSADAFGKFGASDADGEWTAEARRYYFGIVGKYGGPVQTLLKKASALEIQRICPLHGPILTENLGYYLGLYQKWSAYVPEEAGVLVAYASIYGNTRRAAELLADKLTARGQRVSVRDLARCDPYEAVAEAFRYDRLALASVSYNGGVFPVMREFLQRLTDRGYQSRRVALVENGSWAPVAAKGMRELLSGAKNLAFTDSAVRIVSAPNGETDAQLERMADELCTK